MATVIKRRGKWVADYRDGIGRRHWEIYETRRAAEDALAQHVTALRNGRYVPPNNKRTVLRLYRALRCSRCGARAAAGAAEPALSKNSIERNVNDAAVTDDQVARALGHYDIESDGRASPVQVWCAKALQFNPEVTYR
jgi:hypothetical protein